MNSFENQFNNILPVLMLFAKQGQEEILMTSTFHTIKDVQLSTLKNILEILEQNDTETAIETIKGLINEIENKSFNK